VTAVLGYNNARSVGIGNVILAATIECYVLRYISTDFSKKQCFPSGGVWGHSLPGKILGLYKHKLM